MLPLCVLPLLLLVSWAGFSAWSKVRMLVLLVLVLLVLVLVLVLLVLLVLLLLVLVLLLLPRLLPLPLLLLLLLPLLLLPLLLLLLLLQPLLLLLLLLQPLLLTLERVGKANCSLSQPGPMLLPSTQPRLSPLPKHRRVLPGDENGNAMLKFPLRTQGRYIVDSKSQRVKLACVNWAGTEQKDFVVGGLDRQTPGRLAFLIASYGT